MKSMQVKELMVPISDYATVHEDATMAEAIHALENEKKKYGDAPYRHQSLVVIDNNQKAVGRLSQIDIMHALEPAEQNPAEASWMAQSVLSKNVLKPHREQFQYWETPVEEMCRTICSAKVKEHMQVPTHGEFVSETDTLNVAAHHIVSGRHNSLLVTRDNAIVGILRSTDLFNNLYDMMIDCQCLAA